MAVDDPRQTRPPADASAPTASTPTPGPGPTSSLELKSVFGWRRIFKALGYSMQGLRQAWRHEAAFRQEALACLLLVPVAAWLADGLVEFAVLLAALLLVLLVELLNSAIEALADAVSLEIRPLIGRAKDLGSAAVLFSMLIAAAVWFAVLLG